MLWNYAATDVSERFVKRPETIAWVVVLGFSMAFWAVGAIPLWIDVWTHRDVPKRNERIVLGAGVIGFLAILLIPSIIGAKLSASNVPLWHWRMRLAALQVFAGALVALPGVLSIWIRSVEFARPEYGAPSGSSSSASDAAVVTAFREDRDALLRAGTILGATIGLATLATGALRNALAASGHDVISPTLVLAYGAGYTAVLAVVFVPSYITMQRAGTRIRDSRVPMEVPGSSAFEDYEKKKAAWDDLLKLKIGPTDSLKVATAVLAPIVTGLVSLLVGVSVS